MNNAHRRPPTREEQNTLMLIHAAPGGVALMPIMFNGQERFGLILVHQGEAGQYVQLLAVLPVPEDTTLNAQGNPSSSSPPVPRKHLN